MSKLSIWREDEYVAFKEKLAIHRHSLDDEVIELPSLFMEISEIALLAAAREARFSNELKFAKAQAAEALAEAGPKRTAKEMEAAVEVDDDVIEAVKKHERARSSAQFWARLLDAFRAKQSSLKRLGEYMMAGYMVSSSVADVRKGQAEQRKEYQSKRPKLKEPTDG